MFKFIISFILLLMCIPLKSQIVLGPEVGLYYRPYVFKVVSNGVRQNNIEYYMGIMGEVNLGSGITTQSRIAYVFKENVYSGLIHTFDPDMKDAILTNREMMLNVDVLYQPLKNLKVGLGLGMIHKLNSQVQQNFYKTDSKIKFFNPSAYYNASFTYQHQWGRYGVCGRYFYMFKSENINDDRARVKNDKSGFTLGFSYKLLGYNNKKRDMIKTK